MPSVAVLVAVAVVVAVATVKSVEYTHRYPFHIDEFRKFVSKMGSPTKRAVCRSVIKSCVNIEMLALVQRSPKKTPRIHRRKDGM